MAWYPSCWVRLQIRVEDFALSAPPVVQVPVEGTDPVDRGGFLTIDKQIVPTHCSVSLRSYREANECRVTIPYGVIPVDPRLIRQATVQVYMGTVPSGDFARAMGPLYGEAEPILVPEAEDGRSNEMFRGFIDDWSVSQDGDDTVEIQARDITAHLIDAEMPTHGLSGIPKSTRLDEVIRQIILGEAAAQTAPPDKKERRAARNSSRQDVRRLRPRLQQLNKRISRVNARLVKEPANAQLISELTNLTTKQQAVQLALTTAEGIAVAGETLPILAQRLGLAEMRGIRVVNETGIDPLPTIGELKAATWFDSKGNAKKAKSGGASERISYWDFITDLCVGLGFIPYFRVPTEVDDVLGGLPPAELVIGHPRTYYQVPGAEVHTFSYGTNVDTLDIRRNYSGRQTPTGVAVSAIEAKTDQSITSRFPFIDTTTKPDVNPLGTGDRAEYQTILLNDRIPGDNAQEILDNIAQSLYEQISRGEMVITAETTTLTALPSNMNAMAADPSLEPVDMFQLRPGDPCEIDIVPSFRLTDPELPQVTQAGRFWELSTAERVTLLVDAYGFDPRLAALIANASSSELLPRQFYVREVGIDFDAGADGGDGGFKFNIEAINYLDSRNAVSRHVRDYAGVTQVQFQPVVD